LLDSRAVESLFWLALGLVVFSYVGYPTVIAVWSAGRDLIQAVRFLGGGPDRRHRRREERLPYVTVLFSAFNEETCIRQKIENCLALDYPPEKLEVLVGCDGCTDHTAEFARSFQDRRVRVVEFPRAGKASVLSKLVPQSRGDVVVLTDANTMMDRGAAKALVRHFDAPEVGAVVGRLRLYNRVRREYEESLYWRYETILKYFEGRISAVVGANGGIYAIRRLLFQPLGRGTIIDDFVIPVRIAARGWRVPFEPSALAYEETTEDYTREFGRRARIGAGNWQSLGIVPEVLDPRNAFLCFAFVSHKLLRWAAPLLLAIAFALNVPLALQGEPLFQALLLLQLAFYGLAVAGRMNAAGPLRRVASIAHYFVAMNAALAVGFWRFVRGSQSAAWNRTNRGPVRA
jgi:cellulose synthase/poly-beta-1,6-N-acetylglucosamine synthase-like glycosyltransferase